MDIIYPHVAGLDIHKKTVVACGHPWGPRHAPEGDAPLWHHDSGLAHLGGLADQQGSDPHRHGVDGRVLEPGVPDLEASCTVWVVNAQHSKTVPGRKTDVKDAEWIAALLRHGLLKASFIPPLPQRDLRDLTRQRTNLGQARARVVNHLQKVLEWANLKLASVVTDSMGVSARAMLEASIDGAADAALLAELAQGRLRVKQAELARALDSRVRAPQRFMLAQHLMHIDFLEEQSASFDAQLTAAMQPLSSPAASPPAAAATTPPDGAAAEDGSVPWDEAMPLLDSAPGIGPRVAEMIIAEVGTDRGRFPRAAHLASWAKLAPGNHESGGKRFSGKTGRGSRWLRSALVQAAHAAVKVKASHLAAVYHRLVVKRGKQKAIIAGAPRLLVAVYHMLKQREPYREIGPVPPREVAKRKLADRLQRRIEKLGYTVTVTSLAAPAT